MPNSCQIGRTLSKKLFGTLKDTRLKALCNIENFPSYYYFNSYHHVTHMAKELRLGIFGRNKSHSRSKGAKNVVT